MTENVPGGPPQTKILATPLITALEERAYDIDCLNKNMTEMIQQSTMSIAKQTKKQKKPSISSPTRALIKKRREMMEKKTPEIR